MSEEKTYQPKWGEKKEHHHHHHHQGKQNMPDKYTNAWGGWLKMRDKQAYYGLMFVVLAVLAVGAYKLVMMFVNELRAMPMDDPATERSVDELRIRKVEEQDALLFGDSLAQEFNVDSMKRKVQIDTRPVYRPPKREDKWYITKREWKKIWADYKVMRWERKHPKPEDEEEPEE